MPSLLIRNTLSGRKEEFVPLTPGKVKMYVCGVTPYDSSHLGHARTFVSFDNIRRYLIFRGFEVTFVQNVTDIDDKIIRRARERKVEPAALSGKYAAQSEKECAELGVLAPDSAPRVSGSIPQIISLIERLEEKGCAYKTSTGIYFEVSKFADYGKLSRQQPEALKAGARVEVDEEKKSPQDFALWKFGQEPGATFGSRWGEGRPGWHIECSAMATSILGDTIDIHGGARDLIFPHHENEIAQSEAATGKPFVRYFVHTGFLTVNGEKMAKSLGNFITISEGLEKYGPQPLRTLFTLSHYSSPLDFTEDSARAAGNALSSLHSALSAVRTYSPNSQKGGASLAEAALAAERDFIAAMDDDFDTPSAMTALFALAKRISGACSEGSASTGEVKSAAAVLGRLLGVFNLAPRESGADSADAAAAVAHVCKKFGAAPSHSLGEMVSALIEVRKDARKKKDFAISDSIRSELAKAGILLEDRKDGTSGWRTTQ